jgi:hypothetical protein
MHYWRCYSLFADASGVAACKSAGAVDPSALSATKRSRFWSNDDLFITLLTACAALVFIPFAFSLV